MAVESVTSDALTFAGAVGFWVSSISFVRKVTLPGSDLLPAASYAVTVKV